MWEVEVIREKILTDNRWTMRGLLAIYKYQTEYEKSYQETVEHNNVGFNGVDGRILSSIAEFYLKNNYVTEKQLNIVRKKIGKYASQLTKIANGVI